MKHRDCRRAFPEGAGGEENNLHWPSLLAYHLFRLHYYVRVRRSGRLREAYGTSGDAPGALARYWDGRSRCYEGQYGNAHVLPALDDILREERGRIKRVMELGCGTGNNLRALAEHFSEVYFLGLDFSPLMLERARENVAARANVEIRQADLGQIEAYELPAQDLVFSRAALQHIRPEVLRNLVEHLFTRLAPRFYLEETHVRGLADGEELPWPYFPSGSFYNHDYTKILSDYGVIRRKKYKLNNMLSCYAVRRHPAGEG